MEEKGGLVCSKLGVVGASHVPATDHAAAGTSSSCSRGMKRFFLVNNQLAGINVYTYDDDESLLFQPVLFHCIPVKNLRPLYWSPLGSYIAGVKRGKLVLVRTDLSFPVMEYVIGEAACGVGFSPQEKFMHSLSRAVDDQFAKFEIRDLKTGQIRRTFEIAPERLINQKFTKFFKFDHVDNNCAFLDERHVLTVYGTETFCPVESFRKVSDFCWSPTSASVLAFCGRFRENGVRHCFVVVIDFATGHKLRTFRLNESYNCNLIWQSAGKYFACLCTGRDNSYCSKVVLFSMMSLSTQEFVSEDYDKIVGFDWGGNRDQFALIRHTRNQGPTPTAVHFYRLQQSTENFALELERSVHVAAEVLYWSPTGRHVVIQGQADDSKLSLLTFYDVDEHVSLSTVKIYLDTATWDVSGRFFFSRVYCSSPGSDVSLVWSAHGERVWTVGRYWINLVWGNKLLPVDCIPMGYGAMVKSRCENKGEGGTRKKRLEKSSRRIRPKMTEDAFKRRRLKVTESELNQLNQLKELKL